MNFKSKKAGILEIAGFSLLLVLLFFLKAYRIPEQGLIDYDSVKNLQVAREMGKGNFQNLYRHASPGFNLLLAGVVNIFGNYRWAEYLNCGVMLLATLIFSRFVSRELKFKTSEALFLFALIGSSLTLTFLGRSLTFDGLAFFLYCLFLKYYYQALLSQEKRKFYLAAFFYGLLFTVDYKVLLLLPIIILLQIYQEGRSLRIKQWLACALIIFLVFSFFALAGVLVSLPWYKYYLVAGIIPFKSDDHPNRVVGFFNADLLYYFRYLFSFENPLLLIGLLFSPFALKFGRLLTNRKINLVIFLAFFAFCLFLGMSVIQKAPRGLLYAYPLLYTLAFLTFKKYLLNKYLLAAVLISGIAFNFYAIQKNIYQYSQTNYGQIAAYLENRQVKKLAVTVSNKIIPFTDSGVELKEITHSDQLKSLKKAGYEYLLIDDYYKLTGIELKLGGYQDAVLEVPEPGMLTPLLGLEHCEFAGFSYAEALAINKELQQQKTHLRLIRL